MTLIALSQLTYNSPSLIFFISPVQPDALAPVPDDEVVHDDINDNDPLSSIAEPDHAPSGR